LIQILFKNLAVTTLPLCTISAYLHFSQNHRTVEVRKALSRSPSPALLHKQGQLEQLAQDHVQADFTYHHSLSWATHSPLERRSQIKTPQDAPRKHLACARTTRFPQKDTPNKRSIKNTFRGRPVQVLFYDKSLSAQKGSRFWLAPVRSAAT